MPNLPPYYEVTNSHGTPFSGGHEVGFYRDIAPDGQTLEFGVQGEARVWRLLGKPEGISIISKYPR
jgi:hypothetical protein